MWVVLGLCLLVCGLRNMVSSIDSSSVLFMNR